MVNEAYIIRECHICTCSKRYQDALIVVTNKRGHGLTGPVLGFCLSCVKKGLKRRAKNRKVDA